VDVAIKRRPEKGKKKNPWGKKKVKPYLLAKGGKTNREKKGKSPCMKEGRLGVAELVKESVEVRGGQKEKKKNAKFAKGEKKRGK